MHACSKVGTIAFLKSTTDENRNGGLVDLLNPLHRQFRIRPVGVVGVFPRPVLRSAVVYLKGAAAAATLVT
jgi:hypothetical protein